MPGRPTLASSDRDRSRVLFWSVVAAIACAWFLTLDARHLLRTDEGRYAEIAREMLGSGDWVTIRYNGLKYFEKPPFHLWMTALAYQAFGIGEWQARLWVALSGAGGLLVTMLAARRWFGARVSVLTGLVLLAAPAWNLAGHLNSLDMSVSGALSCVLGGVLMAQHPDTTKRARCAWMGFAWAAVGVAVLTKGLIGIVLPGLVLVVYTLAARDWTLWRRLHMFSGALLMLAITLPWFVLVSIRNPEFPQFFFVHEHWQRYTSTVHRREAPWWYFIAVLGAGFLPWLGLMWRMGKSARDDAPSAAFRARLFLALWAAAIFVFFSLSSSKLPGYILPIFPALAVLAGLVLDRLDAPAWRRQILLMSVLLALLFLATPLVSHLGYDTTPNSLYRVYASWMAAACALALAGMGFAWHLSRADVLRSIAVYALTIFAMGTTALLAHETFGRSSSGVDLVPRIRAVLTPDMPIYSVRLLDHTLPFYLRRSMIMVEAPDELEFGTQQEPAKWVPTLDAFVAQWSSGTKAIAVMEPETFAKLRARHVAMVPVAQDERRVVVANFTGPPP